MCEYVYTRETEAQTDRQEAGGCPQVSLPSIPLPAHAGSWWREPRETLTNTVPYLSLLQPLPEPCSSSLPAGVGTRVPEPFRSFVPTSWLHGDTLAPQAHAEAGIHIIIDNHRCGELPESQTLMIHSPANQLRANKAVIKSGASSWEILGTE